MGGGQSKSGPNIDKPRAQTTTPPTSPPCLSDNHNAALHLALAFSAGVLLTLLLMGLVLLIVKSYRKCHSSPQSLDSHSDSLAKSSSIPEKLTSAGIALEVSEEKRDHLIANPSADLDSIVYAQVKVTNSPFVSNKE